MLNPLPYTSGSLPGISLPPIVNSIDSFVLGKSSPVSTVHPFTAATTEQPVEKLKELLMMQQKQVQNTLAVLQHAQKVQDENDTLKQLQQMQMQFGLPPPGGLPSPLRNLLLPSSGFNFGGPASPSASLPFNVGQNLGLPMMPASIHQMASAEGRPVKRSRSDGAGEPARKKRIYVKAACVQCRSSHQACDDGFPCRNCMRSGQRCERGEEVNYFVPPSVDATLTEGMDCPKSPSTASTKSSSPTQDSETGEGRRYVKAACSCCRKAHLACDNFRPCRNCSKSGQLCEQVRSQRRTRRPHMESIPSISVTA